MFLLIRRVTSLELYIGSCNTLRFATGSLRGILRSAFDYNFFIFYQVLFCLYYI
ncbi:DUF2752 domain-containing protein [Bacillus cereus]|nr:DUF2752 domain-containing protein [Bacillus cereus]